MFFSWQREVGGKKTVHHRLAVIVDRFGDVHRVRPTVEPAIGVGNLQSLEMSCQGIRLTDGNSLVNRPVEDQCGRIGFVQVKSR